MPTQRNHGGLYLVTLNNETPISVNARDRRVADRAIQVRRGDIKVGKAENLTRRHGNYIRNFGRDNVNFFVLAYIRGGELDRHRAEFAVFARFDLFRIRGTTGRLNEWMNGVSASDARAMALEALRDSDIEHLVVPEEGEGSADVPPIRGVGRICSAADRTDDANRDADVSAAAPPAGGYAQQTMAYMDVLEAHDVMDNQTFRRLHHQPLATVNGHRGYCAELVANGNDFHQSWRGENNRNVCRRLALIANALSARVAPVGRDEIEALIQQALRTYPR